MLDSNVYEIIGEIGQGSGGIVYKAMHKRLLKEVVIKKIKNTGIASRTETDLLKQLKHSYLPQVLDFIEDETGTYTVMDFIPGSDADKLVRSGRKFRGSEIRKIAVELCEAVSYLHECQPPIIHSDIKPANIMLDENGDICLIDFNVSLVFEKNARTVGGTVGYAPPEQLGIPLDMVKKGLGKELPIGANDPVVNERTDIYSIGASLYYMITGVVPAADYRVKPLSEYEGLHVSDGLKYVVSRAMELKPSKRFSSAAEMLYALKNLGRLDRRYRMIKVQNAVATVIFAGLVGGSAILNRMGADKMNEEREEKYAGYVSEMERLIDEGDNDAARAVIGEASEFLPERIDAYYNYAKILRAEEKYEECADYPDEALTAEVLMGSRNRAEEKSEMYKMAADSAFELEDYEKSAELFEKSVFYSSGDTEKYRDLTISYARLGNIEWAEDSLERAKTAGVSDDRLELMEGEIHVAKGEIEKAFECFGNALKHTDNDYIRFRTLLICDKTAIKLEETAGALTQKVIEMIEGEKDEGDYSSVVKEMLANEYARMGDASGEREWYEKSAGVYRQLSEEGKLGYTLEWNFFNILYSKLADYNGCLELLDRMEAENQQDYKVNMNRSYVLISVQNAVKDQLKRDYSKAAAEFRIAEEKYKPFTENGKTDPNMDNLRAAVEELRSYGWISG